MLLYNDLDIGHISGIYSSVDSIEEGQYSGICIWHSAIHIDDTDINLDYINSTLYITRIRGGGIGNYDINSGLDQPREQADTI